MIGAAALAFDGLAAGGRVMMQRAADRLPDADRQPRGRHAARARRAARGRRRRLRGHAPHARRCSTATASAATLVSYHEHNERERAGELVAQMRDGAVVALVSDAGMPLVSDPGFVLVRACVAAGLAVEVLPGPVGGARGARGQRAARRPLALRRLPAAQARRSSSERSPRPRRWSRSSRRGGVAASLAVLAELDPERPVAVCRELTKIHEEVVRGTAAELAARYAREPPRARSCWWSGRRRATRPAISARRSRRCAGWSTPAPSRAPAATVVAELTGASANALYRALTDVRRSAPPGRARLALSRHVLLHHHRRSTTSTRSRTSATPTRRSPPTCSRATCASAARTCSSSPAPTSTASRSPTPPAPRGSSRRSSPTATPSASRR